MDKLFQCYLQQLVGTGNNCIISLRVILRYSWGGGCCFWEEFCYSWGVGMGKLFHIVSVHQWAQGRLSLFPEFNTEIFWDFYGFGDDCVAWEEIGIHFHIANGEWLV